MATLLDRHWEPSFDGQGRRSRQGGRYQAYLPDLLASRELSLPAELAERALRVETEVRSLASEPGAASLEGLARFLLRSEAIASSKIEGLQVSPQQIALAELAQTDDTVVHGFSANAQLVANNITALRQASTDLARSDSISVDDIDALHRALLPNEKHHGLRTVQNWIGGNDWNPIGAEYVPAPPDEVADLMADLCAYLNAGVHAALIQSALVHAQFETIHPYTDGNGRVGRALIHTVLVRRGVTPAALLPISLVLLTRSEDYLKGLISYRYTTPIDSPDAHRAAAAWLTVFLDAVEMAVDQAGRFGVEVHGLQQTWAARVRDHRLASGKRGTPRSGSATARLLSTLPETPVLTTRSAQKILGVSFPAARTALEELADAKVLHRKQVDRGATGYLARELFDVLTFAERRLASTQWDTRRSTPTRPAPARPTR